VSTSNSVLKKTFNTKKEAIAWGAIKDLELEQGKQSSGETSTFAELGWIYQRRYSVLKAESTAKTETTIINKLSRQKWAKVPLHSLTADDLWEWREQRSKECSPNTLRREIAIMRSVIRKAPDLGVHVDEAIFLQIPKPKEVAREPERITETDMQQLEMAAQVNEKRNPYMKPLIRLAVETGMRRGELLNIAWSDVDLAKGFIRIPAAKAKTKRYRDIPLTPKAKRIIADLAVDNDNQELVFDLTGNAVRMSFQRLRERAGMPHLHFHDFRHESISRFYDMGLTTPEVMAISGHRSVDMVERYSHASTTNLVAKLQGAAQ
tara:strand:- start:2604 stop:3563 length:960 start_codon:yes stop_codon:yes gene_type:complete